MAQKIGVEFTQTGTLQLNDTVFDAAVTSNAADVQTVFNGTSGVFPAIQTLLHFDEVPYASLDASADEHRVLLDAIESTDMELASRLLEAHVVEAGERVARYFEDAESR